MVSSKLESKIPKSLFLYSFLFGIFVVIVIYIATMHKDEFINRSTQTMPSETIEAPTTISVAVQTMPQPEEKACDETTEPELNQDKLSNGDNTARQVLTENALNEVIQLVPGSIFTIPDDDMLCESDPGYYTGPGPDSQEQYKEAQARTRKQRSRSRSNSSLRNLSKDLSPDKTESQPRRLKSRGSSESNSNSEFRRPNSRVGIIDRSRGIRRSDGERPSSSENEMNNDQSDEIQVDGIKNGKGQVDKDQADQCTNPIERTPGDGASDDGNNGPGCLGERTPGDGCSNPDESQGKKKPSNKSSTTNTQPTDTKPPNNAASAAAKHTASFRDFDTEPTREDGSTAPRNRTSSDKSTRPTLQSIRNKNFTGTLAKLIKTVEEVSPLVDFATFCLSNLPDDEKMFFMHISVLNRLHAMGAIVTIPSTPSTPSIMSSNPENGDLSISTSLDNIEGWLKLCNPQNHGNRQLFFEREWSDCSVKEILGDLIKIMWDSDVDVSINFSIFRNLIDQAQFLHTLPSSFQIRCFKLTILSGIPQHLPSPPDLVTADLALISRILSCFNYISLSMINLFCPNGELANCPPLSNNSRLKDIHVRFLQFNNSQPELIRYVLQGFSQRSPLPSLIIYNCDLQDCNVLQHFVLKPPAKQSISMRNLAIINSTNVDLNQIASFTNKDWLATQIDDLCFFNLTLTSKTFSNFFIALSQMTLNRLILDQLLVWSCQPGMIIADSSLPDVVIDTLTPQDRPVEIFARRSLSLPISKILDPPTNPSVTQSEAKLALISASQQTIVRTENNTTNYAFFRHLNLKIVLRVPDNNKPLPKQGNPSPPLIVPDAQRRQNAPITP
ncbi:hypothetical protein NEHOM01_2409 [Nematocida homosporus]|uniref:uncharacterized protein n=1 Tax=Nematocida homosporus TaxID=1912981 RepID=UPI002220A820|nr:uncharacterized protein NEHOM01_2409 [Nematocida homosporus]KAI5187852.1 hypothetical protein NEHOM01_2409 [Nematocida homosporus]